MTSTAHEEITRDASIRRVMGPIVLSGVLSLIVAVTDSLSLAGIATRVTTSLSDFSPSASGLLAKLHVADYPVILSMIALTLVLNVINTAVREKVTADWNAARRIDMIEAYRASDFSTQANYSGAALSVAAEQIGRAAGTIGSTAGLINCVARAVVYVAVSFSSSWQVSVICVAAGGTLVGLLRVLSRRTRKMHRGIARRSIEIADEVGEMAASSRELHILNRWDGAVRRVARNVERVRVLGFRASFLAGLVGPIYWAGTLLVGLAVIAWTSSHSGASGGLATSGILLIRSLGASQGAQVMYQSLNDARPYVDRVLDVIAELRLARRDSTGTIGEETQRLDMEDASLSYGNDVIAANLNLSLQGPGGIAIIGPSGSGKSTTLLSLSGLIEPTTGSINLAGVPLSLLRADDLGHHIGLLPQDPQLLRDILRSNVVRPETDVTDDRIHEVLASVGLTQTVESFGDTGLDTPMGRSGEGFSGGELQRLGLARLLINQPDIWLLDEPTSALDRENSNRVCDLITGAMEHHTVIVVTHRPELLHHCDRIIYMENGVIIDDGPLDVVSARQPFVASMLHSTQPDDAPVAAGAVVDQAGEATSS